MLKKRALKNIFLVTIALFIVLIIYTLKEVTKKTTYFDDAYYINNKELEIVYALNKDNFISKVEVYVDNKLSNEEKVKLLLEILTIDSNKSILLPSYFTPILPKNTKVLNVEINKNILKVTFSKELLNISEKNSEKMLEAIIYTLSELQDIDGIEIYVLDKLLDYIPNTKKKLPTILTKEIGIKVN